MFREDNRVGAHRNQVWGRTRKILFFSPHFFLRNRESSGRHDSLKSISTGATLKPFVFKIT
jgi:hypothetical protein